MILASVVVSFVAGAVAMFVGKDKLVALFQSAEARVRAAEARVKAAKDAIVR